MQAAPAAWADSGDLVRSDEFGMLDPLKRAHGARHGGCHGIGPGKRHLDFLPRLAIEDDHRHFAPCAWLQVRA